MNWIFTYDAISFPEAAFLLVSAKEARRVAAAGLKRARALGTRCIPNSILAHANVSWSFCRPKEKQGLETSVTLHPTMFFNRLSSAELCLKFNEPSKAEIESENTNTTTYHKH